MDGDVPLVLAVDVCPPPLVIKTALAFLNISDKSLKAAAIAMSRSLSATVFTLLPTRPPFFVPVTCGMAAIGLVLRLPHA